MENRDRDYFPGTWNGEAEYETETETKQPQRKGSRLSTSVWLNLICAITLITVLLTYNLTAAAQRREYSQKLAAQQAIIDRLSSSEGEEGYDKLALLDAIFQHYAYYAGDVSQEELMEAVFKAYAQATGDKYAEYYTDEEYAAMVEESQGNSVGVGINVVQTTLTVDGYEHQVFQIISAYENAPAALAGVQTGDFLYAVQIDGEYQTVSALGYSAALSAMRGEKGTAVTFAVFRKQGGNYISQTFTVIRDTFETQSVDHWITASDPTVGVVRITGFDLTTPSQFKEAVLDLQGRGVSKFIFDVRNNPGGDLQSIKAVMTYFLQEGDLILSAIDREGKVAASYVAEPMKLDGRYAACNVDKSEVGMFAELDAVVLCNENTASAAEVFTATMRDYGLATVVGDTTYGKGIMQSYVSLSSFGDYTGYLKMTTYAYVTKCGVTYHEIGITPHVPVSLSEEAKEYNFFVLPEELDDQLLAGIAQFQN